MSWSSVIWLGVAIVAGYWIITSGVIQKFAMGSGGGSSGTSAAKTAPPQSTKPKSKRTGGPSLAQIQKGNIKKNG